jgi:hypothetical protein
VRLQQLDDLLLGNADLLASVAAISLFVIDLPPVAALAM